MASDSPAISKSSGSFRNALLLTAVVILACGSGFRYTLNNPQSMLNYGFHMFGIDFFEPTYLERRAGGDMGFSLKSFASRSGLDTALAGFGRCTEDDRRPQALERQYVIHYVRSDSAEHLEMKVARKRPFYNY